MHRIVSQEDKPALILRWAVLATGAVCAHGQNHHRYKKR